MAQQTAAPVAAIPAGHNTTGAWQIAFLQHQNREVSDNDFTVLNRDHVRARLRRMLLWKLQFDPYATGPGKPFPIGLDAIVRQHLRALIIGRFFDDVCCHVSAASLATADTFDKMTLAVWNAIPSCHKDHRN